MLLGWPRKFVQKFNCHFNKLLSKVSKRMLKLRVYNLAIICSSVLPKLHNLLECTTLTNVISSFLKAYLLSEDVLAVITVIGNGKQAGALVPFLFSLFSQSVSLTQYVVLCACPPVRLPVPFSFTVITRCYS